jgi:hypothetical protein
MAGGVTAANLPHEARNLRRSSSISAGRGPFSSGVIFVTLASEFTTPRDILTNRLSY